MNLLGLRRSCCVGRGSVARSPRGPLRIRDSRFRRSRVGVTRALVRPLILRGPSSPGAQAEVGCDDFQRSMAAIGMIRLPLGASTDLSSLRKTSVYASSVVIPRRRAASGTLTVSSISLMVAILLVELPQKWPGPSSHPADRSIEPICLLRRDTRAAEFIK